MPEPNSSQAHADTRLVQVVHETFRRLTNMFVDATEKLDPVALAPVIGQRWSFYAAILHHHHHTEDQSAFPALVAVRPDMATLVAELEEDHRKLVPAVDAVGSAVAAFEQHPDLARQTAVHGAILSVRDIFFPHLEVEDAKIIPAFAESIPPKQWDRMDNDALKSIPRQYLPTAVGALDQVIRSLPDEKQPPPPPPPIRMMLALSWRRKWAAWVKPLVV
jgi:Hemerythrin HHE cation binding domain